jgi:HTH-type transcriptional regulator, competence development regulator
VVVGLIGAADHLDDLDDAEMSIDWLAVVVDEDEVAFDDLDQRLERHSRVDVVSQGDFLARAMKIQAHLVFLTFVDDVHDSKQRGTRLSTMLYTVSCRKHAWEVEMSGDTNALGAGLRLLREMRGATLREVAAESDISAAYLLKLEKGEVQTPSPHVLRRLSRYLGVSYLSLMSDAGYDVTDDAAAEARPSAIASALSSETLTPTEQQAVAAFLAAFRSQQRTT